MPKETEDLKERLQTDEELLIEKREIIRNFVKKWNGSELPCLFEKELKKTDVLLGRIDLKFSKDCNRQVIVREGNLYYVGYSAKGSHYCLPENDLDWTEFLRDELIKKKINEIEIRNLEKLKILPLRYFYLGEIARGHIGYDLVDNRFFLGDFAAGDKEQESLIKLLKEKELMELKKEKALLKFESWDGSCPFYLHYSPDSIYLGTFNENFHYCYDPINDKIVYYDKSIRKEKPENGLVGDSRVNEKRHRYSIRNNALSYLKNWDGDISQLKQGKIAFLLEYGLGLNLSGQLVIEEGSNDYWIADEDLISLSREKRNSWQLKNKKRAGESAVSDSVLKLLQDWSGDISKLPIEKTGEFYLLINCGSMALGYVAEKSYGDWVYRLALREGSNFITSNEELRRLADKKIGEFKQKEQEMEKEDLKKKALLKFESWDGNPSLVGYYYSPALIYYGTFIEHYHYCYDPINDKIVYYDKYLSSISPVDGLVGEKVNEKRNKFNLRNTILWQLEKFKGKVEELINGQIEYLLAKYGDFSVGLNKVGQLVSEKNSNCSQLASEEYYKLYWGKFEKEFLNLMKVGAENWDGDLEKLDFGSVISSVKLGKEVIGFDVFGKLCKLQSGFKEDPLRLDLFVENILKERYEKFSLTIDKTMEKLLKAWDGNVLDLPKWDSNKGFYYLSENDQFLMGYQSIKKGEDHTFELVRAEKGSLFITCWTKEFRDLASERILEFDSKIKSLIEGMVEPLPYYYSSQPLPRHIGLGVRQVDLCSSYYGYDLDKGEIFKTGQQLDCHYQKELDERDSKIRLAIENWDGNLSTLPVVEPAETLGDIQGKHIGWNNGLCIGEFHNSPKFLNELTERLKKLELEKEKILDKVKNLLRSKGIKEGVKGNPTLPDDKDYIYLGEVQLHKADKPLGGIDSDSTRQILLKDEKLYWIWDSYVGGVNRISDKALFPNLQEIFLEIQKEKDFEDEQKMKLERRKLVRLLLQGNIESLDRTLLLPSDIYLGRVFIGNRHIILRDGKLKFVTNANPGDEVCLGTPEFENLEQLYKEGLAISAFEKFEYQPVQDKTENLPSDYIYLGQNYNGGQLGYNVKTGEIFLGKFVGEPVIEHLAEKMQEKKKNFWNDYLAQPYMGFETGLLEKHILGHFMMEGKIFTLSGDLSGRESRGKKLLAIQGQIGEGICQAEVDKWVARRKVAGWSGDAKDLNYLDIIPQKYLYLGNNGNLPYGYDLEKGELFYLDAGKKLEGSPLVGDLIEKKRKEYLDRAEKDRKEEKLHLWRSVLSNWDGNFATLPSGEIVFGLSKVGPCMVGPCMAGFSSDGKLVRNLYSSEIPFADGSFKSQFVSKYNDWFFTKTNEVSSDWSGDLLNVFLGELLIDCCNIDGFYLGFDCDGNLRKSKAPGENKNNELGTELMNKYNYNKQKEESQLTSKIAEALKKFDGALPNIHAGLLFKPKILPSDIYLGRMMVTDGTLKKDRQIFYSSSGDKIKVLANSASGDSRSMDLVPKYSDLEKIWSDLQKPEQPEQKSKISEIKDREIVSKILESLKEFDRRFGLGNNNRLFSKLDIKKSDIYLGRMLVSSYLLPSSSTNDNFVLNRQIFYRDGKIDILQDSDIGHEQAVDYSPLYENLQETWATLQEPVKNLTPDDVENLIQECLKNYKGGWVVTALLLVSNFELQKWDNYIYLGRLAIGKNGVGSEGESRQIIYKDGKIYYLADSWKGGINCISATPRYENLQEMWESLQKKKEESKIEKKEFDLKKILDNWDGNLDILPWMESGGKAVMDLWSEYHGYTLAFDESSSQLVLINTSKSKVIEPEFYSIANTKVCNWLGELGSNGKKSRRYEDILEDQRRAIEKAIKSAGDINKIPVVSTGKYFIGTYYPSEKVKTEEKYFDLVITEDDSLGVIKEYSSNLPLLLEYTEADRILDKFYEFEIEFEESLSRKMNLVAEAQSASYRVAANQLRKLFGELVGLGGIDNEVIKGLLSWSLGYYLQKLDNSMVEKLSEEFRVEALASVGNEILEELFAAMLSEHGRFEPVEESEEELEELEEELEELEEERLMTSYV